MPDIWFEDDCKSMRYLGRDDYLIEFNDDGTFSVFTYVESELTWELLETFKTMSEVANYLKD